MPGEEFACLGGQASRLLLILHFVQWLAVDRVMINAAICVSPKGTASSTSKILGTGTPHGPPARWPSFGDEVARAGDAEDVDRHPTLVIMDQTSFPSPPTIRDRPVTAEPHARRTSCSTTSTGVVHRACKLFFPAGFIVHAVIPLRKRRGPREARPGHVSRLRLLRWRAASRP